MNLSDGDSSEEDEEIEVAVPNLVDKSSVTGTYVTDSHNKFFIA